MLDGERPSHTRCNGAVAASRCNGVVAIYRGARNPNKIGLNKNMESMLAD
jgi:hypothetical protein